MKKRAQVLSGWPFVKITSLVIVFASLFLPVTATELAVTKAPSSSLSLEISDCNSAIEGGNLELLIRGILKKPVIIALLNDNCVNLLLSSFKTPAFRIAIAHGSLLEISKHIDDEAFLGLVLDQISVGNKYPFRKSNLSPEELLEKFLSLQLSGEGKREVALAYVAAAVGFTPNQISGWSNSIQQKFYLFAKPSILDPVELKELCGGFGCDLPPSKCKSEKAIFSLKWAQKNSNGIYQEIMASCNFLGWKSLSFLRQIGLVSGDFSYVLQANELRKKIPLSDLGCEFLLNKLFTEQLKSYSDEDLIILTENLLNQPNRNDFSDLWFVDLQIAQLIDEIFEKEK